MQQKGIPRQGRKQIPKIKRCAKNRHMAWKKRKLNSRLAPLVCCQSRQLPRNFAFHLSEPSLVYRLRINQLCRTAYGNNPRSLIHLIDIVSGPMMGDVAHR